MPVLRQLLERELVMLLVLFGLGAGPASLLSKRFSAVDRVALSPIIGLCLGTSLFTTLVYFFPADDTAWLVPLLAAASLAVAVGRGRPSLRPGTIRSDPLGWLSILVVSLVITVPILSVMRSQHTIGPASYAVGDAIGYVAETDGLQHQSLHSAIYARPPIANLAQHYLTSYGDGYQNLDLTPLSANVDSLIGLDSTATWQAFLIAFLLAGALGALAAVRWVLRETDVRIRAGAGGTVGVMFAGSLFLQLYFADSQSGLTGLGLLLPLAVIGADSVLEPRIASLLLLSVMVAGLFAIYPLFVAPAATLAGAVVAFLAVRRWRMGGRDAAAHLRRGAVRIVFVLAVATCVNLVSFTRDLRYWDALVSGQLNPDQFGFPQYNMKFEGLPSWAFQTRNLFILTQWTHASALELAEGLLLPIVFVTIIIVALRRFPELRWLLIVIAVAAILGEYEALKHSCSYCTDRSLLPIGPMLAGVLAVGLAVLWMAHRPWLRMFGLIALVAWLLPAFSAERDLRRRVAGAGTFLDSSARAVLARLPHSQSVEVEGFESDPWRASPDDPFTYELAEEVSGGRASIPGDNDVNNSIAYFGVSALDAGQFNPNYQYVLTRLTGVATNRRTIARSGAIALQQRRSALDVTLDGGTVAAAERLDPAGTTWVSNTTPLRMIVAGPGSGPAYVGVKVLAGQPTTVRPQRGITWRAHGQEFTFCARAAGTPPYRVAQISIFYDGVPNSSYNGPYGELPIYVGDRLIAVAAATGHCPFGNLKRPVQPTLATTA